MRVVVILLETSQNEYLQLSKGGHLSKLPLATGQSSDREQRARDASAVREADGEDRPIESIDVPEHQGASSNTSRSIRQSRGYFLFPGELFSEGAPSERGAAC